MALFYTDFNVAQVHLGSQDFKMSFNDFKCWLLGQLPTNNWKK